MKNPKFTFLLPAYKAKFFEEALTSIKLQTYKDFKVIVSDDCSPEDLKCIFNKSVGEDPRFQFRRNKENIGGKSLVAHWNLLVDMCDTEFLIMASDDDVYAPNFLEEIDKLTIQYSKTDLFRGKVKSIDENNNLLLNDVLYPEFLDQVHFFSTCFSNNFISCEANYCYRTSVLKRNGGYIDFPSAWFSDDATHLMMAKNGCAITDKIVFGFRQSNLSISNTFKNSEDAQKKVEASLAFNKWIDMFSQSLSSLEEKDIVKISLNRCKSKIIRNIENNLPFCKFKTFKKLLHQSHSELELSVPVMYYYWTRNLIH